MNLSVSEEESRQATAEILSILQSLTADQDIQLTTDTPFCDLGVDSVCLAYLVGDLQQQHGLGDALYRGLVDFGQPLSQLRVSQLADQLCRARNSVSREERCANERI